MRSAVKYLLNAAQQSCAECPLPSEWLEWFEIELLCDCDFCSVVCMTNSFLHSWWYPRDWCLWWHIHACTDSHAVPRTVVHRRSMGKQGRRVRIASVHSKKTRRHSDLHIHKCASHTHNHAHGYLSLFAYSYSLMHAHTPLLLIQRSANGSGL